VFCALKILSMTMVLIGRQQRKLTSAYEMKAL